MGFEYLKINLYYFLEWFAGDIRGNNKFGVQSGGMYEEERGGRRETRGGKREIAKREEGSREEEREAGIEKQAQGIERGGRSDEAYRERLMIEGRVGGCRRRGSGGV